MERKRYSAMLLLIAVILLIGGLLFRTVVADQYKGSKMESYVNIDGEWVSTGGSGTIGGNREKRQEAVRTGNILMGLGGVSAAAGVGILLSPGKKDV